MRTLIWSLATSAAISLVALFLWTRVGVEHGPGRGPAVTAHFSGGQGDRLAAGRTVTATAPVPGDLAVAGSDVDVTAPVQGYVMAAGGDVTIDAAVRDDVWAAGRNVSVSSTIGDSARLAGGTVTLQPDAEVRGDALLAGRSVEVLAPVRGALRIDAANAVIGAEVGGNVDARGGEIELTQDAVIHGDLIAMGSYPPSIAPGAHVDGAVRYESTGERHSAVRRWAFRWLFAFLALFALGVVVSAPSPRWSARVAELVGTRVGASLLAGVATAIFVPVLAALFAATFVGIPLAIVVLAFFTALVLMSGVFVALRLGAWLTSRFDHRQAYGHVRFAALGAGALLLSFLATLPYVGWITWIVVPLLGVGAELLERADAMRHAPAV